jgi:ubiquinone/menaquinone biosynthesis C-methylase UbiE
MTGRENRTEALSFDDMAEVYDETRTVDEDCLDAAVDFLVERFPPREFPRLIYPGIGTGRIALPLAAGGYAIAGVDISARMLDRLRARLSAVAQSFQITALHGDATELPFGSEAFDLAVAVHLFYFIRDWRKAVREILRVLKREGCLILMHTGQGAEIPLANSVYKESCTAQGHPISSVGVDSTREVVAYLRDLGCAIEEIKGRWEWINRVVARTAVAYMRARAYSFTSSVPEDVHAVAMSAVEAELGKLPGGLMATLEVPSEIRLVLADTAGRGLRAVR